MFPLCPPTCVRDCLTGDTDFRVRGTLEPAMPTIDCPWDTSIELGWTTLWRNHPEPAEEEWFEAA